MSRIQAGIATFGAALAFVPAAYACDEPSKPDERERVVGEAGGKVAFDVPNTLEGARWELRIEDGDELADGVDEDAEEEGVTVGFEVPDLGEHRRKVDLVVDVTHEADNAEWSYEVALDYRGRPEPEPEPAEEPEQEQPAPPAEPPREDPPPADPAPQAGPAPETGSQAAAGAAPPAAAPAPPAAPPAAPAGGAPPMPSADPIPMIPAGSPSAPAPEDSPPAVLGVATAPEAAPAPPARRASRGARRRHVVPRPSDPPPAEPRQPPPADPPEGGIRLPDVDVPGFGDGLAWTLIAVGALSFAGFGLALGGVARHRRRRGLA